MSRKHGGRPLYGWSTQQQGGFRGSGFGGKKIKARRPAKPFVHEREKQKISNAAITIAHKHFVQIRCSCEHEVLLPENVFPAKYFSTEGIQLDAIARAAVCKRCGVKGQAICQSIIV